MKVFIKSILFLILFGVFTVSCEDYDDNSSSYPIQNFIWKGLNGYYLYQPEVSDLSDSKFYLQKDLDNYLSNFSTPESLFENLIYQRSTVDKYSVLYSDYTKLEQVLTGSSDSNGVEYGLNYKSGSTTDIFGWVKYIMPNSDASTKNIQRGTIFYAVNGIPLTASNYKDLLANSTYTLNLADYSNGAITPNGQSVTLVKGSYIENPVFITNTHIVDAKKVGYLMYNGFYGAYENQLNDAFGFLKSEGITHLVLDLRYNSGGSIATATRLASMITGQFNGQIFAKQQWNPKLMARLNPNSLNNLFTNSTSSGSTLNSLNLSKVYILTTKSTASASELVINSLKPYIDVVQIGTTTTGKNVGSITLYNSDDFTKQNVNPNHRYAMQPIVLKIVDKNGFGDYAQGISPSSQNTLAENIGNLGILGNASEPYLAKALDLISSGGKQEIPKTFKIFNEVLEVEKRDLSKEMYIDQVP